MLSSLARLIHRRRRRVLAGAVLLVIVAGVLGGPVAGLLDSDDDFDAPSAQAVQAREAITEATGASAAPDVIALVRLGAPADSAQGQEKLHAVAAAAEGPEVARVDAYGVDGASRPSWSPRTAARATWPSRCATTPTPSRSWTGSRSSPAWSSAARR